MDAFSEAVDEVEEEEGENNTEIDVDAFLEAMREGPKTKTAGFGVTPEMKTFLELLREDDEVDVDPYETFRDHVEKLANRHQEVAEKAQQIHEIKNS